MSSNTVMVNDKEFTIVTTSTAPTTETTVVTTTLVGTSTSSLAVTTTVQPTASSLTSTTLSSTVFDRTTISTSGMSTRPTTAFSAFMSTAKMSTRPTTAFSALMTNITSAAMYTGPKTTTSVFTSLTPSSTTFKTTTGSTTRTSTKSFASTTNTTTASTTNTTTASTTNTTTTTRPSTSSTTKVTTISTTRFVPVYLTDLVFRSFDIYIVELNDSNSQAFKTRAQLVIAQLDPIYRARYPSFIRVIVISFSPGSIITTTQLVFNSTETVPSVGEISNTLLTAVGTGVVNPLNIIPSSVSVNGSVIATTVAALTTVSSGLKIEFSLLQTTWLIIMAKILRLFL
ncbi:uncharacterized protein LOC127519982 [Ctenopharyngodon idella]|uniref:uncharacterized protein LOC127519982 n=1 Tax=Ctenopharyngodon idella TaxID=7959 RepID=UPI002232379F|nr:uncharacterized protein LOC127519982 [Ctenopharyngodon idella]